MAPAELDVLQQPATHAFTCKVSGGVEVSSLDPRSYRYVKLENGIDVVVVSDTLSEKAAAALNVAVGHWSDPSNLPGVAHFCEHMLFLGTERYPEEGAYKGFLAKNSGRSNAYTSSENTCYMFSLVVPPNDIKPDDPTHMPRLKEALDRFSSFFICPLFTESATERELNAVDSENEKNQLLDGRRGYQIRKATSNPNHPFSKFSTGSKKTLGTDAEAAGIDTRAELLAFHKKYYSANLMTLCICGPHSLDILEQWAVELFSPIKNLNIEHPSKPFAAVPPRLPECNGMYTFVDPVKDIRSLSLSWDIPPMRQSFKTRPAAYVARLLGEEGKGSLQCYLKEKQWVNGVYSSASDNTSVFGSVSLSFNLTELGLDHIEDIVELSFGYIRLIRNHGVQRWIYDEAVQLSKMGFHFRERGDHFRFVTRVVENLESFPPFHALSGASVYRDYAPQEIHEILGLLTPQLAHITVTSKTLKPKCDQVEKWYSVAYGTEKISEENLNRWASIEPHESLALPTKNAFIPTSFQLLAEPLPSGQRDLEGPTLIEKNDHFELYHKLDRTFSRPKAHVYVELKSDIAYSCPRNSLLTKAFANLVRDELTEFSYHASVAGLRYSFTDISTGLFLRVDGYNDKLYELLCAVLDRVTTFAVDPLRLSRVLDKMKRGYANVEKQQPISTCSYNLEYLLVDRKWHHREFLQALDDGVVSMDPLNDFVPQLLSNMYAVGFCGGNVSEEWARNVMATIVERIKYKPLSRTQFPERRILQIPLGSGFVSRQLCPNPEDTNSAAEVSFQLKQIGDFEYDVTVDLLVSMLKKPAFHELRTVQQLGYMVRSGLDMYSDVMAIYVAVQSTWASPDEQQARILKFLEDFRRDVLGKMTDDEFACYVNALKLKLNEPEKNLGSELSGFWCEIHRYRAYEYTRSSKEVAALENVKLQDVIDLFDEYIASSGSLRRSMAAMVYGNKHQLTQDGDATSKDLENSVSNRPVEVYNPVAFRGMCRTYPVKGASVDGLSKRLKFWC